MDTRVSATSVCALRYFRLHELGIFHHLQHLLISERGVLSSRRSFRGLKSVTQHLNWP